MATLERAAALLAREIDRNLAVEVEDACERALALARLEAALPRVVQAIGHPALRLDCRETVSGRTFTIYFLGAVLMQWCFSDRCVDLYCWSRGRSRDPDHLRFQYGGVTAGWRLSMPGKRPLVGTFRDEEEKVLEVIGDAVNGLAPWNEPAGVDWLLDAADPEGKGRAS